MKREYRWAGMFLLFAAVLLLVSWVFTDDVRAVLYGIEICAFLYVVFFLGRFAAVRRKCRIMQEIRAAGGDGVERMEDPESYLEKEYQSVVSSLKAEKDRIYDEKRQREQENNEYYMMWIHQIKTPIAALRLLIQTQEYGEQRSRMESELFEIEQYAQMALHYLHLQEEGSDFVLEEYELSGIIKGAVRKYSSEFIGKKLSLELEEFSCLVVTDEKWLGIVIEQLISNCVKYTKNGGVHIYMAKEQELVIADTGIGIREEDLPRIFEKGFTGYNGHMDKRSTGIGLYLCRQIAEKLGIEIMVESEVNRGTQYHIRFLTKMKD